MNIDDLRKAVAAGKYEPKISKLDTFAQRQKYRKASHEFQKDFKEALEIIFYVDGHPKADLLFQLAWEYGHSGGYSEVLNYYIDLVELIK